MGELLAQRKPVPAGCWHPISQFPGCAGEWVWLEKLRPCPTHALLVRCTALQASMPVCGLEQHTSGCPWPKGLAKGRGFGTCSRVEKTLTHLAQHRLGLAWVCRLVVDFFVPSRTSFIRL